MLIFVLCQSRSLEEKYEEMTTNSHKEKAKVRHVVTEKYHSLYSSVLQPLCGRDSKTERREVFFVLVYKLLNLNPLWMRGAVSLTPKFKSCLVALPVTHTVTIFKNS